MRVSHLFAGELQSASGGAGLTPGASPATTTTDEASFLHAGPTGPLPEGSDHAPEAVADVIETAYAVAPGGGSANGPPSLGNFAAGLDLGDGVLAALALGAVLATGVGALLFVGRTRYASREAVLENDVRGRIYAYLQQRVGANLKQITDELALTTTNAIWHLRKLEDAGLVRSRRFSGFKVFYPAEGGVEARRLSLSMTALANSNAKEVLEYVLANPGTHQREIARALSVNHGTVRWHLKKLRTAELLTEIKRGKTSAYYVTDGGRAALEHVTTDGARLPAGLSITRERATQP
jgi:predicted transcriptional regulator